MERSEFIRAQFATLRDEIRDTKTRIFYIAAIGLFVLPGGQYLAKTLDAPLVQLALPLLVVCVGFLYLAENHALMRCGRYIRLHIEPEFEDFCAWEEWLESNDLADPRTVDRYVAYSFYLLLLAYYGVAVVAAFLSARDELPVAPLVAPALLSIYLGGGVIFLYTLVRQIRSSTATRFDPPVTKRANRTRSQSNTA